MRALHGYYEYFALVLYELLGFINNYTLIIDPLK